MNIVAIIGNVASEPKLRNTSQGRAVCCFRVAVSRPGDGTTADFFDVVTWERQAEICKQYLDLGRRIAVEGRMHCRSYRDVDDVRRTSVELVASRVELLSAAHNGAMQRDAAAIFCMTFLLWICSVTSLISSSAAACLLRSPLTTSGSTSRSRGVRSR